MNKSVPIWMLSILAMVFGFASCDRYGNSKTFFVADSLSQTNPKAAMAFIDSVTGKVSGLSDGDRMRLSLLRAKAQNSAGIVFTSDTAMREVVKYYEQHGTGDDRMLAYYIMGSVYRDLDDSPMALQYFQKASEQADTASSDCNYHLLSRIHGQAACLFLAQETPYYALKEFGKAERYSLMSGDTLSALIFYEQRANAYYLLNQMDSVIAVRKRVCDEYLKHGFFEQASLAVGALVHQMLRTGNYVEARKYMNIYDRYAFSKGEQFMVKSGRDVYFSYKGIYYIGVGKTDSAEYFFRKALKFSSSFSNTESACRGLAELYKKKNVVDSVVKYTELARMANDSAYAEKSTGKLLQMKSLYDYGQQQRIAAEARDRADHARLVTLFIIFSFVIVLMAFFIFYYRKLLIKEKENERITREWHDMEMENRKYRDNIKLLKQTKEELNVLLKKYEGEIEKLIRDKSETVEVLQGKIDEYAKKQKDIYTKKKNVEISNSLIVMKFHYFAEKVMTTPSFEDWKELYLFVSNELPELAEFKDVLKHGEYEVCVLVKLGFAPSEISTLTGRKLSDIANVRKRLLVKLANREGSAKDFDNYIKTEF